MAGFSRKHTSITPSVLDARIQAKVANTPVLGPFHYGSRGAVERKATRDRTVTDLLTFSCPSNVVRLIVTVIVDAVNRVLRRRAFTNRGKKLFKRGKPKFNTSPPIVWIPNIVGVAASAFRTVVCLKFRRPRLISPGCS